MFKPDVDPWPSVADPNEELACVYCEALPTERHQPACPLYQPCFEDLAFCDRCQQTFATRCACDGHDDCERGEE